MTFLIFLLAVGVLETILARDKKRAGSNSAISLKAHPDATVSALPAVAAQADSHLPVTGSMISLGKALEAEQQGSAPVPEHTAEKQIRP